MTVAQLNHSHVAHFRNPNRRRSRPIKLLLERDRALAGQLRQAGQPADEQYQNGGSARGFRKPH
jgi:hypothetical protein